MTSPDDVKRLDERMQGLDDRELLRMGALTASDYTPEALEAVGRELTRRNLKAMTMAEYFDAHPRERLGTDGFCADCREATTDEYLQEPVSLFRIGTRLVGYEDQCDYCGSTVRGLWFCFLVPIRPLGRYRVVTSDWMPPYDFVGRKLKEPAPDEPHS